MPTLPYSAPMHCNSVYENINFVHNICPLREMGRFSDTHFTKSATILPSSRNGQTQCPFHELGNTLADFVKWAISQIGRNICMEWISMYLHLLKLTCCKILAVLFMSKMSSVSVVQARIVRNQHRCLMAPFAFKSRSSIASSLR